MKRYIIFCFTDKVTITELLDSGKDNTIELTDKPVVQIIGHVIEIRGQESPVLTLDFKECVVMHR